MANFEFIILPNISHGRPSFAVSFLNKESNLLIITCNEKTISSDHADEMLADELLMKCM